MCSKKGAAVAATIALLLLSSAPRGAMARTVGVSPNDSFVFNYTVLTTFSTPNGNQTTLQHNQLKVGVLWTNTTSPLGEVAYSEAITELNGTNVNNPSTFQNTTTVFDPYDNDTYLGNIGFYPFAYTDLKAGAANALSVSLTVTGIPGGDLTGAQEVNATVSRPPGEIDVNFTIFSSGVTAPPSQTVLRYNASTGVLTSGTTYTHFFSVEKNFVYTLESSTHESGAGVPNANLIIILASVAVVIFAFAALRKITSSRPKGRFAKARQKIGR
ncbi:MAG: hypothetical protein OK455_00710 [Thaumarchaeota archaeon]|nr:hypothetical protein [Nitrososphaerota archaeon]